MIPSDASAEHGRPRIDLAFALWNQRRAIVDAKDRMEALLRAVASPADLNLGQGLQLYALSLEMAPDLVVELGRGYGNSTCVFTEAANRLEGTNVVSVGYDAERGWETRTAPRVRKIVGEDWFRPLEIVHDDILNLDFEAVVEGKSRVLLFWDAHGKDVAEYLLSEAVPRLHRGESESLVAVHDITDARYHHVEPGSTGGGVQYYWQEYLVSPFDELVPLYEFLTRNQVPFRTASEALDEFRRADDERWNELADAVRAFPGVTPLEAGDWLYFTLGGELARERELVFPAYSGER